MKVLSSMLDEDALNYAVGSIVRSNRTKMNAKQKSDFMATLKAYEAYTGCHRRAVCEMTTALEYGYITVAKRAAIRAVLDEMDSLGDIEQFLIEAPRLPSAIDRVVESRLLLERAKELVAVLEQQTEAMAGKILGESAGRQPEPRQAGVR